MTKRVLRNDTDVYLVGNYAPQIVGSKLPSNRDVLKTFYFNMREVKLTIRESAKLVIREVFEIWNKARIPTRDEQQCVKKLETLYEKLRNFQKSERRMTGNKRKNVQFSFLH